MKRKISSSSCAKDVEEDLITCGVCFEKFTTTGDGTPKILTSCGHTFCSKCLNKIFQRKSRLQCPSCRVETLLNRGRGGPESLPINFSVAQLSEYKESSKPSRKKILENACILQNQDDSENDQSLCLNCEGDIPQAAVWGCVDCSVVLCIDCNAIHLKLKMFKNHKIISIEEYSHRSSSKCAKHPLFSIEFACEDCSVMACEIGLALHHTGHRVSSVEEGAERECVKAAKLADDVLKQITSIENQLERLGDKVANGSRTASDLHAKVDSEGGRRIAILTERMAAAHAQIDEIEGKSSSLLEMEKDSLEDNLARARSCLEAAQRVPLGPSAVVKCALSQVHMLADSFSACCLL